MKTTTRHLLFSIFLITTSAAKAASLNSVFPVARTYPNMVGILFPGHSVAAGVNSAALPSAGKATSIQTGYRTVMQSGEKPHMPFVSLTRTSGSLGMGAGYTGYLNGGSQQHGYFAGLGYALEAVSVGVTVRDEAFDDGYQPDLDAGIVIGQQSPLAIGAVFYGINHSARAAVGIGTRQGRRFNAEINVHTPALSDLSNAYWVTASAQVFTDYFGLHFRASYNTSVGDIWHTVALGTWLGDAVHVAVQFSTWQELGGALTFVF